MFDLSQFKGGAIENPKDPRDYQYSDLIAVGAVSPAVGADNIFESRYETEEEFNFKLTHENQNGSLSCVGQATKKTGEGINFLDTGKLENFSARRIYSEIYLNPDGGAYTAKGAEFAVKNGFLQESICPSYEDGKPPSEAFMRQKIELSLQAKMSENVFKSKKYFFCYTIDQMAIAIKNQGFIIMSADGDNEGWRSGDIRPPKVTKWGHAFVGKGFAKRVNPQTQKLEKAIKFHNSWGKNWGYSGDGWIYEDYFNQGKVHSAIALVDQANLTTMGINIKLYKTANDSAVYVKGLGDNLYHPILNGGFALHLFGKKWEDMNIEIIDSIPPREVGYLIGGIVS